MKKYRFYSFRNILIAMCAFAAMFEAIIIISGLYLIICYHRNENLKKDEPIRKAYVEMRMNQESLRQYAPPLQQQIEPETTPIIITTFIPPETSPQATQDASESTEPAEPNIPIHETEKPQETPVNDTEEEKKYYDNGLSHDLQDYIRSLCEERNMPFELALAVIEKESSYNHAAVSADGHDHGLMQIRDVNHGWLSEKYGVTDFSDPRQNALCGVSMLSEYLDKYEDMHKALMAYNFGEGGAKRHWQQGTYSSKYSRKVVDIYERIKGEESK